LGIVTRSIEESERKQEQWEVLDSGEDAAVTFFLTPLWFAALHQATIARTGRVSTGQTIAY
jgi:hypothetical protein